MLYKKPSTDKIKEALTEFGCGSELLDDAFNELDRIEEYATDLQRLPASYRAFLQAKYPRDDRNLMKLLGVKELLKGTIKVKDDSQLIYKGKTLPVLGILCIWKSGTTEYLVSLVGTEFQDGDNLVTTLGPWDIETIDVKPWSLEE